MTSSATKTNYPNMEALKEAAKLHDGAIKTFNRMGCEEALQSFRTLFSQACEAKMDPQKQYVLLMRAAEIGAIIIRKNGFEDFKRNKKPVVKTFYDCFKTAIKKCDELDARLRLDFNEKARRATVPDPIDLAGGTPNQLSNGTAGIAGGSKCIQPETPLTPLSPLADENTPPDQLPKCSISPKELIKRVENSNPRLSAIIVDYRENRDVVINYSNDKLISVVVIPNSALKPGLIFNTLKVQVDVTHRALLNRLSQYDIVVFMDEQQVELTNNAPPNKSAAQYLMRALWEYNTECKPRRLPMFMEGGFAKWRLQYPMYTTSTTGGQDGSGNELAEGRDELSNLVNKYMKSRQSQQLPNYPDLSPKHQPSAGQPTIDQQRNASVRFGEEMSAETTRVSDHRKVTTFGVEVNGEESTAAVYRRPSPSPTPSAKNQSTGSREKSNGSDDTAVPGSIYPQMPKSKPVNATVPRPHQNGNNGTPTIPPRPTSEELRVIPQDSRQTINGEVSPGSIKNGISDVSKLDSSSKFVAPAPQIPVFDRKNKPQAPAVSTCAAQENGYASDGSTRTQIGAQGPAAPLPDRANKPAIVPFRISRESEEHLLAIYMNMGARVKDRADLNTGRKQPGCTGLYNMGNTCFMNATLQALFHTPDLGKIFTKESFLRKINPDNEMSTGGVISAAFSALMDIVWSGQYSAFRPFRFLKLFAESVNSSLADGQQHDASEFHLFLLDSLHEDTNRVVKRRSYEQNYHGGDEIVANAADYAKQSRLFSSSPVNEIFNLQTVSELSCSTCGERSAKFEECSLISLELPQQYSHTTLDECLRAHFSKTNLEGDSQWNCPKCRKPRNATRRTKIWTLPPVIVIHLKRFSLSNGEYVKNTMPVSFDIDHLELRDHLHERAPRESAAYQLYAVTNHRGSLNSGHYTSQLLHATANSWLRFDDESVYNVNTDSLDPSMAYLLYYKRKDSRTTTRL